MTTRSAVCKTSATLRADAIRKLRDLGQTDVIHQTIDFLKSLNLSDEGKILSDYPVLYRELSEFLATGKRGNDPSLGWLYDAIDIAHQGYPDEYLPEAIREVRQVLGLYSRLTVGSKCTHNFPWRPVVTEYEQDTAVSSAVTRLTRTTSSDEVPFYASYIAELIFRDGDFSAIQTGAEDVPFRHGPGAVAEGSKVAREKSLVNCVIDPEFDWVYEPFFRPLFPILPSTAYGAWEGRYSEGHARHIEGARASKIVCVPKDFRGPRVIAAEPLLHQYVQQGLMRMVYHYVVRQTPMSLCIDLERSDKNAEAAKVASATGEDVTIDLKDASDLVSLDAVQMVFNKTKLWHYLRSARTLRVSVGTEIYPISAFAPMGSGLCFLVETLFFAILCLASAWEPDRSFTYSNLRKLIRKMRLRVYGDDIIVHRDYADGVISALEGAGCVVNHAKTCRTFCFRESCGYDGFGGFDITPLRPRHLPGASAFSYDGLIDMAQEFAKRGYLNMTAQLLSYCLSEQSRQGFKNKIYFVSSDEQFAGKPGVVTLPGDTFDLLTFFADDVNRTQKLSVIACRTRPERDDVQRRLREALRGLPRDASGFIVETTSRKPIRALRQKRVRAISSFHTPRVLEINSKRALFGLLSRI